MSSPTVLLAGAVVLLLSLVVAAAASAHLQIGNRVVNKHGAQNLAESAAALAIREIVRDQNFGKSATAGYSRVFRATMDDDPANVGLVTFDPAQAGALNIAPSYNNAGVDAPANTGWGRPVPKECVQIMATGRYHGCAEVCEITIFNPTFDEVVSCAGPIATSGATLIARVRDGLTLADLAQLSPADLLPGAVASQSPGQALHLGGATLVKGDAQARGQVGVFEQARVEGRIMPGSARVPVPQVDFNQYAPKRRQYVEDLPPGSSGTQRLVGHLRCPGDLTVTGTLRLDQAQLWVEGNLVVNGPVAGKGLVICDGKIDMGSGNLESDNQIAVLSRQGVTVRGADKRSSFFRGIIYTEGDVSASHVTILGALAANLPKNPPPGPPPAAPTMTLHDVTVYGQKMPAILVQIPFVLYKYTWTPAGGSPVEVPNFNPDATGRGGDGSPVACDTAGAVSGLPFSAWDGLVYDAATGDVVDLVMDNNGHVVGPSRTVGHVESQPAETHQQALMGGHTQAVALDFNKLVNPADRLRIVQWRRD